MHFLEIYIVALVAKMREVNKVFISSFVTMGIPISLRLAL
jgi:hypothetical protein